MHVDLQKMRILLGNSSIDKNGVPGKHGSRGDRNGGNEWGIEIVHWSAIGRMRVYQTVVQVPCLRS